MLLRLSQVRDLDVLTLDDSNEPEALNERRAAFVVDGALNEGALTAGLIKSRCLVILSWFLFGKGNFFGFLIVAKIVSDNLANMGYTDAGEGLVQQLLARSDLVLLALATGGLMTTDMLTRLQELGRLDGDDRRQLLGLGQTLARYASL